MQKARTTDPSTSHDAAEAIRMRAGASRAKLLLAHYDDYIANGWDHSGLIDEEAAAIAGLSLDSEYATRCSELRKCKPPLLMMMEEERTGRAGVERKISRLTKAGRSYVQNEGWR